MVNSLQFNFRFVCCNTGTMLLSLQETGEYSLASNLRYLCYGSSVLREMEQDEMAVLHIRSQA